MIKKGLGVARLKGNKVSSPKLNLTHGQQTQHLNCHHTKKMGKNYQTRLHLLPDIDSLPQLAATMASPPPLVAEMASGLVIVVCCSTACYSLLILSTNHCFLSSHSLLINLGGTNAEDHEDGC